MKLKYLWRFALLVCVASFAVLFGVFAWPTQYRHDHIKLMNVDLPVRIDRFTGKTEILYQDGWRNSNPPVEPLPPAELAKLDCASRFDGDRLSCDIYNGSRYTLKEIVVHIHDDLKLVSSGTGNLPNDLVPVSGGVPNDLRPAPGGLPDDLRPAPDGPSANAPTPAIDRDYRLCGDRIESFTVGSFSASAGFAPAGRNWSWHIKSASGVKE